jgi:hypothetical protein
LVQLKEIGEALNTYAADNGGLFPPLSRRDWNFIFEGRALYPDYVQDPHIFACPSDAEYNPRINFRLCSNKNHPDSEVGDYHADCVTDMSYMYLGWVVTTEEEAKTFLEAYCELSPSDYDKDIIVPEGKGNGGSNVIYRLRKDIDRIINNPEIDASKIPVLWDKPSAEVSNYCHVPAGIHVLYLDGHTDYYRMSYDSTDFPASIMLGYVLDQVEREPIPDCRGCEE